ncbi:hypothetical protein VFPFJ_11634 [Purpureocillium lilacinum]|uniref:Uncharacterized protein n=1 Tax=Purpureocillium lilacinum TaxID=33203 RepID=A0A179F0I2_PURLI|nr:hypothetical protein VFPFJ_11634 [Purpureocillium lilacinum]OAQ58659.1 hypothetical protein VFPFJ_11634 [Purpureocillium lilacinum]
MEDAMPTSKDLRVGIDFGTSGIRVAIGRADEADSTSVPMRELFNSEGQLVPSTKFPSAVQFGPGLGQYKLLGNRAANEQSIWDVLTTSSGAKLSLDPTQSKAGDAAHFLELCKEYKVDPDQVRLQLLGVVKEKVDAFLAAEYPTDSDPWERVVSTRINIPYIWSSASEDASYSHGDYSHGDAIQRQLLHMIEKVGFPNVVTPENEAMSALRYHIQGSKELLGVLGKSNVRALFIDAGEGTTDMAPVELFLVEGTCRGIEIAKAEGCSGGTSYIWNRLAELCRTRCANDRDAAAMYHLAQLHFFKMGERFEPFAHSGSIISKEFFEQITERAYKGPLDLAVKEASQIENLDLIMVSGAAFTNKSIRRLWRERLESETERQSGDAATHTAPKIVFLKPNDASDAVAKGACLPYDDDPIKEFHKSCFGILIDSRRAVLGRGRRKRPTGRPRRPKSRTLLQFKRASSYDFEPEFQTVCVQDPKEFLVEPHYLMIEPMDLDDENQDETTTTEWDATSALPMGNLQFNLQGKVGRDKAVGVRFRWRPDFSNLVLLELAAGSWRVTQQLQLVRDMDRVYFIEREVKEWEEDVELGSHTNHDEVARNPREIHGGSDGNTSPLAEVEAGPDDVADDGAARHTEATGENGVAIAGGEEVSPPNTVTMELPRRGRKRSARAVSGSSHAAEDGATAAQVADHDLPERTPEEVASESQRDRAGTGTVEEVGSHTAGTQGGLDLAVDENHEERNDRDTTQNATQSTPPSQEVVVELDPSALGSPSGEAARTLRVSRRTATIFFGSIYGFNAVNGARRTIGAVDWPEAVPNGAAVKAGPTLNLHTHHVDDRSSPFATSHAKADT